MQKLSRRRTIVSLIFSNATGIKNSAKNRTSTCRWLRGYKHQNKLCRKRRGFSDVLQEARYLAINSCQEQFRYIFSLIFNTGLTNCILFFIKDTIDGTAPTKKAYSKKCFGKLRFCMPLALQPSCILLQKRARKENYKIVAVRIKKTQSIIKRIGNGEVVEITQNKQRKS